MIRAGSYRLFEGIITKVTVDRPDDSPPVEVNLEKATVKDIKEARAADPVATRKLLEMVRKDAAPPYRRNKCGFAAIVAGRKK
jgi:hypothetical protein